MGDDNIKTKILDIQVRYEDAIRGIAKYQQAIDQTKDKQKELRKELNDGQITIDEYNMEMAASKLVISENNEVIRILNKEIQNNIKAEKQQQDSLVAMRASLSNLTRQYDEMSEAERESASGQDLEIHINAITDKIKEAEEKTQRFYRNVGSYQQAFEKVLSPLKKQLDDLRTTYIQMSEEERKGAAGDEMRTHIKNIEEQLNATSEAGGKFQNELLSLVGIQGGFLGSIANSVGGMESMSQAFMAGKAAVSAFGKQLLALLMNPIVAIIAGIALVIMGLVKAINSSEEASDRVSVLLAPLKKMLDGLLHVIQILAAGILLVAEAWAKLYDWQMKLMEKLPLVGGVIKEINDSNREAIELAKEKIAMEVQSRDNEVQNAKDALEVSKLRTLAKDKEKYTSEERLKFVKEANKLEEEQSKRNVELAERKLKALQIESTWAENNTETNRELAKLEAEVYRARKEFFDKTRELKEQENTIIQEGIAKVKAEADAKKKAAEEAIKIVKEQRDKEREAIRKSEDTLLALVKNEADRRRQEVSFSYKREIEDLKQKLSEEKNLTVKAKDAIRETIKLKEQQLQVELAKLSNEQLQKDIEQRQKLIELQLASIKSGSEQEYQLKMQQLITQRDMELSNTELTEQMKLAIKAKYDKQMDDMATQRETDVLKKQQDAVKVRFETEIAQAHGNEEEILRIKVEQKRVELDSLQQMEGESLEAFNLRKVEIENAYLDAKQDLTDKQVEIEQVKFQATADITNSLSALADAAGEHSKELAMASKILALAEIAINTGKAIAAGVAQAQSVPFPGNIAAIATTIATVIANITTAIKTVKSAKFASGGRVTGPGTGTSDTIPANLSDGESVLTAKATDMFAPILSSFNMIGGGVPINVAASSNQTMGEDMLARAVAKGVQMMPRPVVSVEEINTVSNRVEVLEGLGSL